MLRHRARPRAPHARLGRLGVLGLGALAAASACSELTRLAVLPACPNEVPEEGAPCEPGLSCSYVDPDCGRYFLATCGDDGRWHFEGNCAPAGGAGGGGVGGTGAGPGGSAGAAGAGGQPCVDPSPGPPFVTSATELVFPPDAEFGTYRLEWSEPVTGLASHLVWAGSGELDGVAKVGAVAYRVRFSGIPAGESATLAVLAGVADECGTVSTDTTEIDLSRRPHCHYLEEGFEGDFLGAGWSTWDEAGDGNVWARSDELDPPYGVPNHTAGSGTCAAANDVATGAGSAWDAELYAPELDLTAGAHAVLFYETDFQDEAGAGQAWLEASADGSTWSSLTTWTLDHGPAREIVLLDSYVGGPLYLRWRYTDDGGAGAWWDVDDACVEEYTKASCPCPAGGRAETADVPGGSNGNGTLGTAEATGLTLSAAGQRVSVCGLLEDAAASGADYHTFDVDSGLAGGTATATVSYCLESSFEDATIQVWAKGVGQPLATVATAHTEGTFPVDLVDGATHYVSLAATTMPYTPARYAVTVEIDSMVTPILAEGFETWPPASLTPTDDVAVLEWAQSSTTVVPSGYAPTEGAHLAFFNSYDVPVGSESLESAALSFTGKSSVVLSFDLFHDPGYLSSIDTVQVQVDIGAGFVDVGPAFERPAAVAGWTTETVDLALLANRPSARIRLVGTTAYGNDIHIDDVKVLAY